ncbi:MAG: hypothetical protein RI940_385 [Bacteroidota bacterium]|jgi:hypothetical protein
MKQECLLIITRLKRDFFCNTERAFEKQTKVQVKVRLGSVEQTQKLEGYNLSRLPAAH